MCNAEENQMQEGNTEHSFLNSVAEIKNVKTVI